MPEKMRFKTLCKFSETWFTIDGLRNGKIGNLLVKILKEFAICNFIGKVLVLCLFKFERFETAKTQERHCLTIWLHHISVSRLE